VADQPTCLCIISGERIRGGDFIAALRASLRPHDQLEIIVDRRGGETQGEWERAVDRRRRPQVDAALRTNGFAMVPAPASEDDQTPPSRLRPSAPSGRLGVDDDEERLEAIRDFKRERSSSLASEGNRTPLSRLVPSVPSGRAFDDDDDERLEAIRDFRRERSSGLVPWLVAGLVAVATAAFLLSPTGQSLRINLVQRISPEAPGPSNQPAQTADTSAPTQAPAVAEKPASAPTRTPGAETAPLERTTRGSASLGSAPTEPAPSRDNGAVTSPSESSTPPVESAAPSRAATGMGSKARPRSIEPVRPSPSTPVPAPAPRETASVPSSPEPVSRTIAPRFAGLPRIELIREASASGGAYAVRIADPTGKPLSDAEVLLIARMADGTLENVRMGFVPEQGTYRGTLPPVRSAPVDLRIRVITGDKRVEIPIGP